MGCLGSKTQVKEQKNESWKEQSHTLHGYGSTAATAPASRKEQQQPLLEVSTASSTKVISSSSSATPSGGARLVGQFAYLEKSYSIKTPSCLVPRINELFKSICDRYDVAVVNREKVDEALTLFKQVLGVDRMTPMEECFTVWKDCLANPRFTLIFNETSGDVKDLRVRANTIPKEKRMAQKHIRDLLDACHLFLQQKEFLQRHMMADIVQLESLSSQLQNLGKSAGLSSSERKQLPRNFETTRRQFSEFLGILDMFFVHIFSLMKEINTSVHILQTHEDSVDPV